MKSNRIGSIDFMKFIFSCCIVFLHGNYLTTNTTQHVFVGGYIGVEFFFLVSGALLAKAYFDTMENGVEVDSAIILKRKFFGLMPNYYVAWIIGFAVMHVFEHNPKTMLAELFNSIWELLLIKPFGFVGHEVNSVTWYLTVMLVSTVIICQMMKRYNKVFFTVISPLVFLFIIAWLRQGSETLSGVGVWTGFTTRGMLRGFAEMLAGCFVFYEARSIRVIDAKKWIRNIVTMLQWCIVMMILVYIYRHGYNQNDYIMLVGFMIVCLIAFSGLGNDSMLFDRKLFYWLGEYSYSLYLGHMFWIPFWKHIDLPFRSGLIGFFISSLSTGLVIMYVSRYIKKAWRQSRKSIVEA